MDHRVAVGVEVEPLLADRGGRQHEGPEGGVERRAHLVLAGAGPAVEGLLGAEADGEVVAQVAPLDLEAVAVPVRADLVHGGGAGAQRQRLVDALGECAPGPLRRAVEQALQVAEGVDVLVQDRLELAGRRVGEDLAPVRPLRVPPPRADDGRRLQTS